MPSKAEELIERWSPKGIIATGKESSTYQEAAQAAIKLAAIAKVGMQALRDIAVGDISTSPPSCDWCCGGYCVSAPLPALHEEHCPIGRALLEIETIAGGGG